MTSLDGSRTPGSSTPGSDGPDERPAVAGRPATGRAPAPLSKRVLVELSHAIERFALATKPGAPLVVLAMFQRHSYFAREQEVYRRIAARSDACVVGLVAEDGLPVPPPGVRQVLLHPDDRLAREWSVVVLGPGGGAVLVATDEETVAPGARTLEEGRRFRGRWSFRRSDACREVLRLRTQLPMQPDTVDTIDAVLRAVLDSNEPAQQDVWEVPLRFLAERLEGAVHDRSAAQERLDLSSGAPDDERAPERDPRTGLHTAAFYRRWTAGLGAGLPMGVGLVYVPGVAQLRERYGLRAEIAALQGIARSTDGLLGPVDRMVRVDEEEFLLLLPSCDERRALGVCDEVCDRLEALDRQFPFVALTGHAAATVTRERPLPLHRLREQLGMPELEPA